MKCLSLVDPCPRPWRLAPRALRERLECSEGGNTGRRAQRPYRFRLKTAVRSAPNQDRRNERLIGGLGTKRQGRATPSDRRFRPQPGRCSGAWTHKWTAKWRHGCTAECPLSGGKPTQCGYRSLSPFDPTATLRKQTAEAPISQWQLVAWLCGCLRIDPGVHWAYTFTSPVRGEDSTHGAYE